MQPSHFLLKHNFKNVWIKTIKFKMLWIFSLELTANLSVSLWAGYSCKHGAANGEYDLQIAGK